MTSYVEQLEVLRDHIKDNLVKRVEAFSVDKCVRKVVYVSNTSKEYIVEIYEAYIYYKIPPFPVVSIVGILIDSGGTSFTLNVTIECDIYQTIIESGFYYSTTGAFDDATPKYVYIGEYGSQNVTVSGLVQNTLYYLKPYIKTCAGISYSDIIEISTFINYLQDTYFEFIDDTYLNKIYTTWP